MRREEIQQLLIEKFGKQNQLEKVNEELLELLQAIQLYKTQPCDKHWQEVLNERSDVENMLEQLDSILNISKVDLELQRKVTNEKIKKALYTQNNKINTK